VVKLNRGRQLFTSFAYPETYPLVQIKIHRLPKQHTLFHRL